APTWLQPLRVFDAAFTLAGLSLFLRSITANKTVGSLALIACWITMGENDPYLGKAALRETEVNQLHLDRVEQAEPVAIHDQWLKDIFNFCPLNEPTSSSSRLSDKCFLTSGDQPLGPICNRMIDLLAKFGYWVIFKTESWVLWSEK
ncbi:hypothetical protein Tco_0720670, partial [Tanacetum coccineum]